MESSSLDKDFLTKQSRICWRSGRTTGSGLGSENACLQVRMCCAGLNQTAKKNGIPASSIQKQSAQERLERLAAHFSAASSMPDKFEDPDP